METNRKKLKLVLPRDEFHPIATCLGIMAVLAVAGLMVINLLIRIYLFLTA